MRRTQAAETEIGKVPLLTAAQEVDLARRIEAGECATELRELTEEEDRVDQKRLRQVTAAARTVGVEAGAR